MPHDPDPRAFGAVTLQQVQRATVEHALLDRVRFAGGPDGERAEFVRQDEPADGCAEGEEERAVGEYQQRVPRGAGGASVVVRIVLDEGE
jgi:hypothetical protein